MGIFSLHSIHYRLVHGNGHMIMQPTQEEEIEISIPALRTIGAPSETQFQQSVHVGSMTIPCQLFPFDWTNASARVMRPHRSQPIRSMSKCNYSRRCRWKIGILTSVIDTRTSQGSLICRDLKTSVNLVFLLKESLFLQDWKHIMAIWSHANNPLRQESL